jgi:hypothetical protein
MVLRDIIGDILRQTLMFSGYGQYKFNMNTAEPEPNKRSSTEGFFNVNADRKSLPRVFLDPSVQTIFLACGRLPQLRNEAFRLDVLVCPGAGFG